MEGPAVTVPPIRSTRGCWTCRLRKKKCDERQPTCVRCNSVPVQCHYRERPEWMADSVLGKAELARIKVLVWKCAKQKRAAFHASTQSSQIQAASADNHQLQSEPCMPPNISILDGSSAEDWTSDAVPKENSTNHAVSMASSMNSSVPESVVEGEHAIDSLLLDGENETRLMMHYLDHVFSIQFRFYTPSVSAGGRGWLLSLLHSTKPLYHAALSLSAFHQQSLLSVDQNCYQTQKDHLQELERHHNLTLEELQLFIFAHGQVGSTRGQLGSNVQILACMVELISFELFNGGDSNWQVHLTAASTLILSLYGILPATKSESIHYTRFLSPADELGTRRDGSTNNAALEFFTGVIIWFDILACVSTGSTSNIACHLDHFLSFEKGPSNIDLQAVMGCQNWAMQLISEIAQLDSWRHQQHADANEPDHQSAEKAKQIRDRLQSGTSTVRVELEALHRQYSGVPPHYISLVYDRYTTLTVTNTFATAALLYLQSSTTSTLSVFHIQDALQDAISAIRLIPDPRMIRGMFWPLCVAGCLASSISDQDFFRRCARAAIKDAGTFGNSSKALDILEMAWKLQREEGRLIDCTTCIEQLGVFVLLV